MDYDVPESDGLWAEAYRNLNAQKRREQDQAGFDAISEHELLRRAVQNARDRTARRGVPHERAVAVQDVFALGSTYAGLLCRKFGFDPCELVKR